jgi:beta-phosphoglucomutase-like phosphatase (HAD superfamily)
VFAGDIVPKKKPAPDIYLHALQELGRGADDAIVVEDSENGLRAALAAGLRTVVTVSSYTAEEDFGGASLVVSSLGDPGERAVSVLANPLQLSLHDFVRLDELSAILAAPLPGRLAGGAPTEAEENR